MTATQIFTVFAGILALVGAYFYFFGIDPETKRALERKALQTMGENKMSYMAKGTSVVARLPNRTLTPSRSDQQDPRIRPGRHQGSQERPGQRCWRTQSESYRGASW
jgi:hypothetical protein